MRAAALGLILLTAVVSTAAAQVDQGWVARYNGAGNYNDVAYAMTVDAAGSTYVTGSANLGTGTDCVTIKYDAAGNQVWLRSFNGGTHDLGVAITVDPAGNVFVAGASNQGLGSDYLTLKYNAAGVLQWARFYEGPVFEEDFATSIALDSAGNAYVTGYSTGDGTALDYATIKYSAAGIEQWVRRVNGAANGDDVASSIAVDASGVYVAGGSNYDFTTIKYDASGAQLWLRSYNGPGNAADNVVAMALDPSGNICVTGMSPGVGTGFDYATIKYDASGAQQWVRRFNGPANDYDYVAAMAINAAGDVYVTGNSFGDYGTVKYDPTGTEQWARMYDGPAGAADQGSAIAVDAAGQVYVTGTSFGNGTTLYDYATLSYDASGSERWVERYNGPGNFYDQPHGMAIDGSGNVYVTGQSGGSGSGLDYATIRYSQTAAAVPVFGGATRPLKLESLPNPFRGSTTLEFAISADTQFAPEHVRLAIYDVQGREVALLVDGDFAAGKHQLDFDATGLVPGIYYARLDVGHQSATTKLVRFE